MTSGRHLLCHVVLSLAVVAIAHADPPPAPCPSAWIESSSGTCVRRYNVKKSWEDARATCKEDGADLVKILDESMNVFIWGLISSSSRQPHWLGLHDRVGEDNHHWLDQTDELNFTKWAKNQPNNGGGWEQDCVEMGGWTTLDEAKWNDADCSSPARFFCEKSQKDPSREFLPEVISTPGDSSATKSSDSKNTVDQVACPSGWSDSPHSGTCIKLYDEKKIWQDARGTCNDDGGDLVKIMDASMNQFIWDQISSDPGQEYWIGLHDLKEEGRHQWLDETEEIVYFNWGKGQPYPHKDGQDCVEIGSSRFEDGKWEDIQCIYEMKFICEKPGTASTKEVTSTPGESSATKSSDSENTVDQAPCPSAWIESSSGTCVRRYNVKKSWEDARATCKEDGADLVKILDESMNVFIWGLIALSSRQPHWLGLHDRVGEDNHHWLDQTEELNFTKWAKNQPNNGGGWEQDCVEMGGWTTLDEGKWNDADCSSPARFFCEKSQKDPSREFLPEVISTPGDSSATKSSDSKNTVDQVACPSGWSDSPHSGTCIKLYDEKKIWQDARGTCIDDGGDLVKIMDASMNQFIWDQISSDPGQEYWIGLHDLKEEGRHQWLDETEEIVYFNWGKGQPYPHKDGQDCVEIGSSRFEDGKWEDIQCIYEMKFICEKPGTASTKEVTSTPGESSATKSSDSENKVDQAPCPSAWIESSSGTCVRRYNVKKSWEDARATCKEDGADLVKILDESMNVFIWGLIALSSRQPHWLGLHDRVGEDNHHWLDQTEELNFTRWAKNQPNNGGGWEQDCVEMGGWTTFDEGKWNDADCSSPARFFCEKSQKDPSRGKPSIVSTADLDVTTISDDEQLQNDKQEVEDTSTLKTTPKDADTHLGDQHVGETTTPADSGADHDEQQVVETTTLATIGHVRVQPPGKEAAGDEKRRKYPITTRPHENHQSRTLNKIQDSSGGNELGVGAVTGIIIATLVACVALVGAAILGRRFYLARQPKKSYNVDSSTSFVNVVYDATDGCITDSNAYFNNSEA